jgi:hypothetical protein
MQVRKWNLDVNKLGLYSFLYHWFSDVLFSFSHTKSLPFKNT